MSHDTRWGDACLTCGHPAAWHGASFCQVDAGGPAKRRCDCSGYATPAAAERDRLRARVAELEAALALARRDLSEARAQAAAAVSQRQP